MGIGSHIRAEKHCRIALLKRNIHPDKAKNVRWVRSMKRKKSSKPSSAIPEVIHTEKGPLYIQDGKIPHLKIVEASKSAAHLVDAYRTRVLAGDTRTIRLLGKKQPARILHTLLGYEVQASYKRIQCPDLVTARYLKLFTELGCRSIRLPYDPTLTAELIPQFEAMVTRIENQVAEYFPQDASMQHYVLRRLFSIIRRQLRGE